MTTVDTPVRSDSEIIVKHLQLIERLNALTHRIDRLRLLLSMVGDLTGADDVAFTSPDLWNTIFWVHETVVVEDRTLVGNTIKSSEVTPDLVEAAQTNGVNPFDVGPSIFVAREFGVTKVMALRAEETLWGFLLFRGSRTSVPDSEWFGYVLSVLRLVATEHVTASNQTKFVNEVAHDTKGVLTAVTLAADFMYEDLQELKLSRKFSRQLGRLFESVQQASSLLDNAFSLGKYDPETDELQMSLVEVDLFELRRAIVGRFQLVAKFRGINLVMRGGRGKAVVNADRSMLARVLTNLLQNAFKFTPAGGTVTIDIQKGDPVVITVEDTGVGIAPEHHEAIFQRKFQVQHKTNQRSKGHGLGLYIVRKIVEQHAGTVHVESELGAGAKFVVQVPVSGPTTYYDDF